MKTVSIYLAFLTIVALVFPLVVNAAEHVNVLRDVKATKAPKVNKTKAPKVRAPKSKKVKGEKAPKAVKA